MSHENNHTRTRLEHVRGSETSVGESGQAGAGSIAETVRTSFEHSSSPLADLETLTFLKEASPERFDAFLEDALRETEHRRQAQNRALSLQQMANELEARSLDVVQIEIDTADRMHQRDAASRREGRWVGLAALLIVFASALIFGALGQTAAALAAITVAGGGLIVAFVVGAQSAQPRAKGDDDETDDDQQAAGADADSDPTPPTLPRA